MNRAKFETIDALLSWVAEIDAECQRNLGNGHKIHIFGKPSKDGVSVHFDLKKPERSRPSVNQIVRKHFAPLFPTLQGRDFILKPELTNKDKDKNNEKMDVVRTIWHTLITLPNDELIRGDYTPADKKISIQTYVRTHYESDRQLIKSGTDNKSQLLKHLKKSGLPDVPLCAISEKYCDQFSNYLSDAEKSGLNYSTPSVVFQTFSHILSLAVKENYLKHNPCLSDAVTKPKLQYSEKTHFCLEESQVKQMLAYFEGLPKPPRPLYGILNYEFTHWESMRIFLFACYTGLRISDIETLKHTDLEKVGNHYYFSSTIRKTKTPTRKRLSKMAEKLLFLDTPDDSPNIFSYVSRSALNNNIIRGARNAGLELKHRLSIHKARHTFASILLLKGFTESQIQFELDHKTDKMTKHYVHITQAMANRIDSAFD